MVIISYYILLNAGEKWRFVCIHIRNHYWTLVVILRYLFRSIWFFFMFLNACIQHSFQECVCSSCILRIAAVKLRCTWNLIWGEYLNGIHYWDSSLPLLVQCLLKWLNPAWIPYWQSFLRGQEPLYICSIFWWKLTFGDF